MPENAGDYSTRYVEFGPLTGAHERPQRLLGEGQGVLFGGAYGDSARPGGYGAARRPTYEGRGRGAYCGSRDREVAGPVGHGAGPCLPREQLDPREAEEVFGRLGELAEAVYELLCQVFHLGEGAEARGPAVEVDAFDLVHDVLGRQVGIERELDDDGPLLAPLLGLASGGGYGLLQQVQVHLEADGRYVPRLLGAQQVSGAPDLQVTHGDGEPAPELREVHQSFEALLRLDGGPEGGEEVGVGLLGGAPDPAPQLVELGQPHRIGAVHYQGVGRGHVEPALDDGRRNEDVGQPVQEVLHYPFERPLGHLPVRRSEPD